MKASEFERALFRSAEEDEPSPEQRRANRAAVMRAAGIAAAAGIAVTSATTSTAPAAIGAGASVGEAAIAGAGGAAGAGAGGAAGAGAGAGTAVKSAAVATSKLLAWIKVSSAVIVLGGVAGTAVVVTRSSDDARVPVVAASASAPSARPVAPKASPAPPDAPAAPVERDETEARTAPLASSASRAARGMAAPTSTKRSPSTTVDPLASEVALLEAARRCLDASEVACASKNLDAHRARFGRGNLAGEAMVLRIDLARAQGDPAKAHELAKRLLDESPNGPYAARAKAVLAEP